MRCPTLSRLRRAGAPGRSATPSTWRRSRRRSATCGLAAVADAPRGREAVTFSMSKAGWTPGGSGSSARAWDEARTGANTGTDRRRRSTASRAAEDGGSAPSGSSRARIPAAWGIQTIRRRRRGGEAGAPGRSTPRRDVVATPAGGASDGRRNIARPATRFGKLTSGRSAGVEPDLVRPRRRVLGPGPPGERCRRHDEPDALRGLSTRNSCG